VKPEKKDVARRTGSVSPQVYVPGLVESLGKNSPILDKLNFRQQRFVEEYLVDANATRAAIRAGYSAKSATDNGYGLLRNPKVADAITALMVKRSERTGVNRAWVLSQLVDMHETVRDKESATFAAIRLRALEVIGKHVDVRAFRLGLGLGDEDGEATQWDLSRLGDGPLSDDYAGLSEFEVFERLLHKIAVTGPPAERAGGAPAPPGNGADHVAPGGDSGGV
jgi:hypothetical protein